jgi:hypothetical protein
VLVHVVLYKLKDPTPENMAEAVSRLQSHQKTVPTVRSLEVGGNVVPSARAYDVGLVVKFDDRGGLDVYQPHPNHVPVAAYMRAHSESVVSVDFEI